jgi:hypothetical protein
VFRVLDTRMTSIAWPRRLGALLPPVPLMFGSARIACAGGLQITKNVVLFLIVGLPRRTFRAWLLQQAAQHFVAPALAFELPEHLG